MKKKKNRLNLGQQPPRLKNDNILVSGFYILKYASIRILNYSYLIKQNLHTL